MFRRSSRLLPLAFACVLPTGLAQGPQALPGTLPHPEPGTRFVDRKESWIELEVAPMRPIVSLDLYGPFFAMVEQSAMRLSIRLDATGESLLEFPTGLGVTAAALAPGGTEIWLVDRVASCITVIDLLDLRPTRTIAVGAEPHDIEFHPSGDRAWVSCTAAGRVDVISTSSYTVVGEIDVPMRQPRGLAFADGILWTSAFLSGNGTTVVEGTDQITNKDVPLLFDAEADPVAIPLPDLDLIAIVPAADPSLDAHDSARDVRGLGTVLFDVFARPGTSELWIPNTEGLNTEFIGEKNFIEGQVVSNRVSIVDAAGLAAPVVLDLDALAPAGVRCAQPTSVAFHPSFGEAYVAGYGSDVIAVLDVSGSVPTWKGHFELPRVAGDRVGVRNLMVKGDELLAFSRGQVGLTRIALDGLVAGTITAPAAFALAVDPTPANVRRGRMQLSDAGHSKSLTTSCASCHVDGHLDLLSWDLSAFLDPEGTAEADLTYEIDRKGPMLTQSLRDLSRTAPLHWRGEKLRLDDFNSAFVDLMEREVAGVPEPLPEQDFSDLEAFVESLAWPANPTQEADRSLTPDQAEGRDLFRTFPSNPNGTCAICHREPFGTSGELLRIEVAGMLPEGLVVPQLRGAYERSGDLHDLGLGGPPISDLGFGVSHDGSHGSILRFIEDFGSFAFDNSQAQKVTAYLENLDTGLAPSSATQFTLDPTAAATGSSSELEALLADARAGWCDVVVTGGLSNFGGGLEPLSIVYDPRQDLFQLPFASASVPAALILAYGAATNSELLVNGVPPGMGRRLALDPDADQLLTGDEYAASTDPLIADTDGDGFSDGHEQRHGTDPLVPGATSLDTTPPNFLPGPSGDPVVRVWGNTRTIQLEFATDEPTAARVFVVGSAEPSEVSPAVGGFSTYHQVVVTELPGNSPVTFLIEVTDEAGLVTTTTHSDSTQPLAIPIATRIESIDVQLDHGALDITVEIADRDGLPVLGNELRLELFIYVQDENGALQVVKQGLTAPVIDSFSTGSVPLPPVTGAPGTRKAFVGVRSIRKSMPSSAPPGYVEALDLVNFAEFVF